jgi:hypothetical protein
MTKTATTAKLFASGVLFAFLVACGGGGGDSAPASADPGSSNNPPVTSASPTGTVPTLTPLPELPENQPWKSVFADGVTELSFTASGCDVFRSTGSVSGPSTSGLNATVTVSLGSTTISVKATVQTVTFAGEMVVGNGTDSSYRLSLPSGTSTLVNELYLLAKAGTEDRSFVVRRSVSTPTKQEMFYTIEDGTTRLDLACRGIATPLRTTALNVNLPERVALLMQTSKDTTVTSGAEGCVAPSGASRFTYSVSKTGEIKLNDALLPADWLTGAANLNSKYSEAATFEPSGVSSSIVQLHNNSFEGVSLVSNISRNPSFSHRCYP